MAESLLVGKNVGIVGASLGGLSAANVLHQMGANVLVFERHTTGFENRGSGLGYVDLPLWQKVRGTTRARPFRISSGGHYYGDLWKFLYDGLPPASVRFGHTVNDLGGDVQQPTIEVDGKEQRFDLVILADGGWSSLRGKYVDLDGAPEYAGYVLWRGLLDWAKLPNFRSFGFNFERNTMLGSFPIGSEAGTKYINCGFYVAMPEQEVPRPEQRENRHVGATASARDNTAPPPTTTKKSTPITPEWFLPLVKKYYGTGELFDLFQTVVAQGKLSPHPVWEYCAPRVVNGRVMLLGDSAHMASPNTGSGAHNAVLDALALAEAFKKAIPRATKKTRKSPTDVEDRIDAGLALYNREALPRAQNLLARSYALHQRYVPRTPVSPTELLTPSDYDDS